MPRYFFESYDGERVTPDPDGLLMADLGTARAEAVKALPEMARDVLPDGQDRTVSIVIHAEDGRALFRASLTLRCEWLIN